jgi:hypothetical protein
VVYNFRANSQAVTRREVSMGRISLFKRRQVNDSAGVLLLYSEEIENWHIPNCGFQFGMCQF